MGKRYGIVGYNGTRKIKRPKPIPPKPVVKKSVIIVEDTVEVVTAKEEIPEVIEPEVFEKICESVVEAGEMTAEEANADCWDCMMSKECCTCNDCDGCLRPKEECVCDKNPVEEVTKLWVEEKSKPKKKTYKKKKYKKRTKKTIVTSSSAPVTPAPVAPVSLEDPSTD